MHFALTGAVMALHYQTFIQKLRSCPIMLAHGTSGTGKTIAIHCRLALLGVDEFRLYHKVSAAKALELCSVTSIPLGYDDPDTQHGFSSLLIDLYGGKKEGKMKGGDVTPISTVIISSKIYQQKYVTCLSCSTCPCLKICYSIPEDTLQDASWLSLSSHHCKWVCPPSCSCQKCGGPAVHAWDFCIATGAKFLKLVSKMLTMTYFLV